MFSNKFYMGLYSEFFRSFFFKNSWLPILVHFPSIVMFGMKGFYVSASGAIQGHHGPLVQESNSFKNSKEDHGRNVSMILHQNRLSSFGEENI